MPDASPAAFVRLLAAAVVRDGEPDALARDARGALDAVFSSQKSLVLDVQFTGFTAKGQPIGGVSPELLRGAGQLIMMRVSRVGFTPDAREEDLASFFEIAARGPGDIGPAGIVAALKDAAPRGLYLSTSGGETYRPAPAPKPAAAAEPAASSDSAPAAASTGAPASTEAGQEEATAAPASAPATSTDAPPPVDAAPAVQSSAPDTAPSAAGSAARLVDSAPPVDPVAPDETRRAESQDAPEPSDARTAADAMDSRAADESESSESAVPPEVPAAEQGTASQAVTAVVPGARADAPGASGRVDSTAEATAPSPKPKPVEMTGSAVLGFEVEDPGLAFSDFEVLEAFPEMPDEAVPAAGAQPPGAVRGEGDGGGELYHFFRSSAASIDPEAADLPELLRRADSLNRFDEVAQGCARTATRLVQTDQHAAALDLLEALIREAERPDRTRVFREAAVQSLRRAGTEATLHSFVEHVQRRQEDSERVARLFLFLGGEAAGLLEGLLFRTGDPELRSILFRRTAAQEGAGARLLARTMSDPAPGRTRAMLELAATSELGPETALRWIGEAATHADSTVRMDAARHAATVGGRGGLRVLVDLLSDADRLVKRDAIKALGTMGDAAAVPFLARVLNEASDEDVQLAIIAALGKIASPDALPTLLAIINKRHLFAGRKLQRVKAAAVGAIGRMPGASARDVLASIAAGKDTELAAEARRTLALLD
ncbi:MAG: hypothetical protein JWM27_1353 [Gemmatimonadetes bacterium]|nr:hypothetical protein [Gemmatimonadota bacterium]